MGKPRCGAGLFFWGTRKREEFPYVGELVVGKGLIKDDNFFAVLFLSLTGLDFSLWLVSSGLSDWIRFVPM